MSLPNCVLLTSLLMGQEPARSWPELSGAHAPSLHRFMRALTTIEICNELEDGSFGLTPMGALLRSDNTEFQRGSHGTVKH